MTRSEEIRSRLMETDVDRRRQFLRELARDASEDVMRTLGQALIQSHWPVCDEIADALAEIGGDGARDSLLAALKGRRHHVRSAAIKALARLRGAGIREAIEELRSDPSYEVRQDVSAALQELGAESQ